MRICMPAHSTATITPTNRLLRCAATTIGLVVAFTAPVALELGIWFNKPYIDSTDFRTVVCAESGATASTPQPS
ncbi:hypothetical protein [Nibrella viscosa]|uniref:hypothetical protein n=1 Tax=Nibrella viscosa TaxID=1084524 RepID=UPI0031EE552A